ncbi:MAG TPA: hypothetical protein VNB49_10790 [Candidatus Dormibacteraeota bacterium]|nr:hypothetical protein [Candidatus Dormibacteraeota bacterium]
MKLLIRVLTFLMITLLAGSGVLAQNGKSLTNQDVISMVKSLLPESVILSAIKTNDADFDVSATGLIALKKAGVSAKVMEAMLDAANNKKNGASTAPAASGGANAVPNAAAVANGTAAALASGVPAAGGPAWQPTVAAFQGTTKINLTAEATQIVQTKTKPTSLAALAADQALDQALQVGTQMAQQAAMKAVSGMALTALNPAGAVIGGFLSHRAKQAKVTYVWALGGGSSNASSGNTPSFEVNYAGLPGVNADQFEPVIVKLSPTPQANFRLVGATEAATTAEQSTQQDWPIYSSFVEDRVKAKVEKLGAGHAKVTPEAAMSPGEYAVALRPVDKSHKFSGEEVGKNQAEGLLFNYAWAFSVK